MSYLSNIAPGASVSTIFWGSTAGLSAGQYQVGIRVYNAANSIFNTTVYAGFSLLSQLGISKAPTLNPIGSKSVKRGELLEFNLSGSDPEGSPLKYQGYPLPYGATLDTATGKFKWIPTEGQSGSFNISFQVSDGALYSATQTVTITVAVPTAVPPAPANLSTKIVCDNLYNPGSISGIYFDWDPVPEADSYIIRAQIPSGVTNSVTVPSVYRSWYPGGFLPVDNELDWWITAVNNIGQSIETGPAHASSVGVDCSKTMPVEITNQVVSLPACWSPSQGPYKPTFYWNGSPFIYWYKVRVQDQETGWEYTEYAQNMTAWTLSLNYFVSGHTYNWWLSSTNPKAAGGPASFSVKACDSPLPTPTPTPTLIPSPTLVPITQPAGIDKTPPTVSITAPVNGAIVARNFTITLQAGASDNVAVANVDFLVNGSLICSDTTSPYSCNWKTSGKPNTTYSITAKAYDTSGNTNSAGITVKSTK